MIKEAYCSFEVSKLLKEKGMDKEYFTHYIQKNNTDGTSEAATTCTHQMAMKWLREEKNILIYAYPVIDLPVKDNYTFYWRWDGKKKRHDAPHIGDKHNYESFEQAVEAALKYALENLI